ncbi:MAG: hypothetical protein ACRDCG_01340 [Mycoplasmoidaceae bacterium]
MIEKKNIAYSTVKEINLDHLVIEFDNKLEKCWKEEISDYPVELNRMFTVNRKYKFTFIYVDNKIYVSYKLGRPKLLKKKLCPAPTLSGFKNISNNMHSHLKLYKIKKVN